MHVKNIPLYRSLTRLILEFGKFGVVSIMRTIIGIAIILIPYNLWGINYIICNVAGYSIGLIVGFTLHKTWTFRSQGKWSKEALPYLVSFGIGFLGNIVLLLLLAEKLRINKNVSLVLATLGFTIINYLGCKFWVFRQGQRVSN